MLIDTIREDRIKAMKARDEKKKSLLGVLVADACKDEKQPDDVTVVRFVKKFIENARENLQACEKGGGSSGNSENAQREIEILTEYLPAQLTGDALVAAIRHVMSLEGIEAVPANMGKVMKALGVHHAGGYDGREASGLVKGILSGEILANVLVKLLYVHFRSINDGPFNDLEVLIDSQYPIICIETHEEARVEEILTRICSESGLPFFHWVATAGLTRSGEPQPVYNTRTAMEVLNFICSSSLDAVYLMKDLHRYLEDPLLVRKLRDLCRSFRQKRKSLVLTAPTFDLPPELSNEVVFFELSLPAVDELKTLVLRVVRDISSRRKIAVKMDAATGRKLVESLKGLTLHEAERVLTRAIVHDGRLSVDNLPHILDAKKQKISQSGLIEFFPRQELLTVWED